MPTKRTQLQQARKVMDYYLDKYNVKYRQNPAGLNRTTLVYGFKDFMDDYPSNHTAIIDYYFSTYLSHDPKAFLKSYGDIAEEMIDDDNDAREREELYRETIKRLKEQT